MVSVALLLTDDSSQLFTCQGDRVYVPVWPHKLALYQLIAWLLTHVQQFVVPFWLLCVLAAACQRDQEDSWSHYT